ncbi:MAG: exodeoxyribonuclease III [Acidimicrobiales bacterium]|nr:MAG: exodeoxyribonuclease III [Acidimicrobiales bacterium]
MRIVTWNVNSLNARLGRVERWLQTFEPDVLCLQETKLADDAFPALTFEALGYETFHHGQGQWNGVAILSRVGIENPIGGFGDGGNPDPDARIAWATCGGVRVASCYVPNGRSLDHEHYQYKLRWLDRLAADLDGQCTPADDVVVCGDFNIAPDDRDVYDPAKFATETHASAAEREKIQTLLDWGLVDVFREHHDDGGLYSWWDYRGGNFHKKLGMRIDLLLTTRSVADRVAVTLVDRNERKGPKDDPPSDHAPVLIDGTR